MRTGKCANVCLSAFNGSLFGISDSSSSDGKSGLVLWHIRTTRHQEKDIN